MSNNVNLGLNISSDYSIKEINGCMCIFGSIPIDVFSAFTSMERFKGSIMSFQISRLLDASIVIGQKENIETLYDKLKNNSNYKYIKLENVSPEANEWYVFGEQGVSSATMFKAIFDKNPFGWETGRASMLGKTPSDSDDLSRCINLYNLVPEVREHFYKIRKLSNAWNNIYINWGKLCKFYKEERFDEVNKLLEELKVERVEN